jgi:hypothetical protein
MTEMTNSLSTFIKENILENVLSKNTKKTRKTKAADDFKIPTCDEYYKNHIQLKSYKLPDLKMMVKHYKLPVTGNKGQLIERIETYFKKMIYSMKIQKLFRGFIVRLSFKTRGPAVNDRKICVNDTDFVTLEPLDEIPFELFYSYKDTKDFVYGFNLTSIVELIKKRGKIINPYNREVMDIKHIREIITLYNIIQFVFTEHKDDTYMKLSIINERPSCSHMRPYPILTNRLTLQNIANSLNGQMTHIRTIPRSQSSTNILESVQPTSNNTLNSELSSNYFNPRVITHLTPELRVTYNKITEIRRKPIYVRIQELFMEIDQLGNYTNSEWFSGLQRQSYYRLYRILHDIWFYRGGLSHEIKLKICPLFEPFSNIFNHQPNVTEDHLKISCLTVIENMVYSGVDDDHRKIGALHVLSALTVVSAGARETMPWLYESVAY